MKAGPLSELLGRFADAEVTKDGFDLTDDRRCVYAVFVESMRRLSESRSLKLRILFQAKLLHDKKAVCYLVDLSRDGELDTPWIMEVDGERMSHERMRVVSVTSLMGR